MAKQIPTLFSVPLLLSVQSVYALHKLPLFTTARIINKISCQDLLQLLDGQELNVPQARDVRERCSGSMLFLRTRLTKNKQKNNTEIKAKFSFLNYYYIMILNNYHMASSISHGNLSMIENSEDMGHLRSLFTRVQV